MEEEVVVAYSVNGRFSRVALKLIKPGIRRIASAAAAKK
jgi:hypothetical protein